MENVKDQSTFHQLSWASEVIVPHSIMNVFLIY